MLSLEKSLKLIKDDFVTISLHFQKRNSPSIIVPPCYKRILYLKSSTLKLRGNYDTP